MFMCSNVNVFKWFKCSCVQMLMCSNGSNVHVFKCSCVQMFMFSNVHVFKCSFVQMFMFSNVHVFKCSCVQILICCSFKKKIKPFLILTQNRSLKKIPKFSLIINLSIFNIFAGNHV